jgi:KaiC/GvpD/RAD55 family RecA-like ATPase
LERIKLGVEPLDFGAPSGFPRKSLILISGDAGTGKSVIVNQITNNLLMKGEPAVYVTLDDDPTAVIDAFRSFGWSVDEFIEKGLLKFIDGFSFRLGSLKKQIKGVVREIVPDDTKKMIYVINEVIEESKMVNKGILILDSINELMFQLDVSSVIDFVKTLRAAVPKARGVITIITLHTTAEALNQLKNHLEYLVDGVIDTRLDPNLQELGIPLKQLNVKKLRGAPTNPLWIPYVIVDDGIRPVDQHKLSSLIKAKLREAVRFEQKPQS